MQPHGRARKAALLGDGEKGFELIQIHWFLPGAGFRCQGSGIKNEASKNGAPVMEE
jgi:hypothetical protein